MELLKSIRSTPLPIDLLSESSPVCLSQIGNGTRRPFIHPILGEEGEQIEQQHYQNQPHLQSQFLLVSGVILFAVAVTVAVAVAVLQMKLKKEGRYHLNRMI